MTRNRSLRGVSLIAVSLVWWLQTISAFGTGRSFVSQGGAIDVAICLDTSTSMDGLIDAARLKLWEIVNDLSQAEPTPRLRVALLTFGNKNNDLRAGWVRVETDLTTNLDLVSERLFALTSDGGSEYVGRVLGAALALDWSRSEDALKLIFVAGNEPADQDPQVSFREMSDAAIGGGIFVSAVYCGGPEEEDAETWKEMAHLSQGQFATIDHTSRAVVLETPFDKELVELGTAVNDTYLPLGEKGRERLRSLEAQDENAAWLGTAVAASRAAAKSGRIYTSNWDLIDALEAGRVDLYELDESELPEVMRSMTIDQRVIYVQDMKKKRDGLRKQITELNQKRLEHIAEQREAKGIDDSWAFDSVVRRTIRKKAEEKGFYFPQN